MGTRAPRKAFSLGRRRRVLLAIVVGLAFLPAVSSAVADSLLEIDAGLAKGIEAYIRAKIDSATAQMKDMMDKMKADLGKPVAAERQIFHDCALPADQEEYEALDKNAILLVMATTREKKELPLKRVFAVSGKVQIELKPVLRFTGKNPSADMKEYLGEYSESAFYLLPMYLIGQKAALFADWGVNREGFSFGSGLALQGAPFAENDQIISKQKGVVASSVLKAFLAREFSLRP